MNPISISTLAVLGLCVSLIACTTPEQFHTASAINEECSLEMQSARTAVRLRDKGKPEAWLKDQLVPLSEKSSRLLINMHDIVDEAFSNKDLNETTYSTYRFELCMRQLQARPYPTSISAIKPDLLACQSEYGDKSSAGSTQCIIDAIDNLPADKLATLKKPPENTQTTEP